MKRRQIVLIDQGCGHEGSGGLRDGIGQDLAPGESAEHCQGQGDGGIQMRARDLAGNVDAHGDGESPSQSDVGVAAVDYFAGSLRRKEHNHGDDSGSQQDQHEGSQKFGDQLGEQRKRRIRLHSVDPIRLTLFG